LVYLLFVGSRAPYKDFSVLAQAFAGLAEMGKLSLVAVGDGPFTPPELATLSRLGIDRRARQVDLSDHELAGAYSHALCFVYPSRYEGFGLPALEAMACGCPVILADSSSLPEIGGSAAHYFPPGDHAALGRLIADLVPNEQLRAQRRQAGLARAALFSWRKTARLTAAAYHALRHSR
jgi:glycosyltransferase involved in cell wall biosynthesis